jgi:hypothetical protein
VRLLPGQERAEDPARQDLSAAGGARLLERLGRGLADAARRATERTSPRVKLAAALFAILLLLLGGGGLAFQLLLPSLLPSALDWEAVGALLDRDARPGDAVMVSPAWAERIRSVAPRRLRVLARSGGAPAELQGVRRVWLVSLPRAPGFTFRPEIELLAQATAPDPPLAVGGLSLTRLELTHPELPLASLREALGAASVTLGGLACTGGGGLFECRTNRGQASLERGTVEVNGLPRSCLLVRTAGEAARLAATFPEVPVGRVIRGNAGLVGAAGAGPASLALVVRIDGEEASTVQLEGAGWPSFRLDTSRWAGGRHAVAVELVIPEERELCLDLVMLP